MGEITARSGPWWTDPKRAWPAVLLILLLNAIAPGLMSRLVPGLTPPVTAPDRFTGTQAIVLKADLARQRNEDQEAWDREMRDLVVLIRGEATERKESDNRLERQHDRDMRRIERRGQ